MKRHLFITVLMATVITGTGCRSIHQQKLTLSYLGVSTNGVSEFSVRYQMDPGERVCPNDAFMTSSIVLDGVQHHPPMDGLCGMECLSYPENTLVRFPILLDTYCYLSEDESALAPSGVTLTPGRHSVAIKYAGHQSHPLSFTVKDGKKPRRNR